jgi:predicted ester cyclase
MKKSFCAGLMLIACMFIYSCGSELKEIDLDANRDVVRDFHRIWSDGNVMELEKIISPDFVCHFINDIEWKGIDGAKHSITSHRKIFPDWKEEIVDMVSEGDKVVTRYRSTGTQLGAFEGLDATGIKVTIYETSIYRIADGKIAEQWGFPDALSLKNQLTKK